MYIYLVSFIRNSVGNQLVRRREIEEEKVFCRCVVDVQDNHESCIIKQKIKFEKMIEVKKV